MKLGEYEEHGRSSKMLGRHLFRGAISEHAPEVLDYLSNVPYEVARRVFDENRKSWCFEPLSDLQEWEDLSSGAYDSQEGVRELRQEIERWGTRFHLEENWCYTLALQTLMAWVFEPDWREDRRWGPMGGGMWETAFRPEETELGLLPFKYDPTHETYKQALQHIRAITSELKSFVRDLHSRAEARGLEKTRGIAQEERYRWLAEYQVNERTMYGVWKELATDRTEQAVRAGIHTTAEVIGLRLRPTGSERVGGAPLPSEKT